MANNIEKLNYEELKKQREEIDKLMEKAKAEERKDVIKKVRELCKEFKITAGHLKGALAEGRKPKA